MGSPVYGGRLDPFASLGLNKSAAPPETDDSFDEDGFENENNSLGGGSINSIGSGSVNSQWTNEMVVGEERATTRLGERRRGAKR